MNFFRSEQWKKFIIKTAFVGILKKIVYSFSPRLCVLATP